MKIAVTADLHLTSREEHPERYHALENILSQMVEAHIHHLIIAGDLFDASLRTYADFEALCRDPTYEQVSFYVIPGNHDPKISHAAIAADSVHVITQPQLLPIDPAGPPFLFVPYEPDKTMGESVEPFRQELTPNRWILVGHGDWSIGLRDANPYEPGVFMPLTTKDVHAYWPAHAFLGHIHKPLDDGRVHRVGSPCGLDITEAGPRRFLVHDTESGAIEPRRVDTDVIYFDEFFVCLPTEDEQVYVREQAESRIRSWGIRRQDSVKVQVRVRVGGYSSDRTALLTTLKQAFQSYPFYRGEEPDISQVSISDDPDRSYVASRVQSSIDELEWDFGPDEPSRRQIALAALDVIYGS